MATLSRRQETLIRSLSQRQFRRKSDYCLCDGLRSSSEIVSLRPDLVELVLLREGTEFRPPLPVEPVVLDPKTFDALANSVVNSQGIIVIAKRPDPVDPASPLRDPFILVLDKVGDPGNFGTIIRTARAVGLKEIWTVKGCVDPFADKTLRSASGAQFAVGIREIPGIPELTGLLAKHGISRIYRTLPDGGESVFKADALFEKTAIVLGAEAGGVSEIEESFALNIPMPGTAESLNVAQAATVILFEYVRRSGA